MAKIDTWIDLANLYYQAGALEKAIAAYQKIIRQGCSFGIVYNNLASALASQGNIREAIPHYQKCIELLSDPKERAIISTRLGECHRLLGDYDGAITAFKKAYEIDPGNPAVMKGLGEIQADLENNTQVDEPVKDSDGEMSQPAAPEDTTSLSLSDPLPLHASLAEAREILEPHSQALSSAEMTANPAQDDSVRATLQLTLGIMHWRNGSLDDAENILRSSIDASVKIQNNWLQALCWHALALLKTDQGHIETAIGAYRQAVSLAPDQIFPWCKVGSLYNGMGCSDEAMLAFQRAIRQNPEDTDSWDGLGDIYTKLGRLDDGIAAYQLGNIFEKRPQGADAIKAYEKAFQLYKLTLTALVSDSENGLKAGNVTPAANIRPSESLLDSQLSTALIGPVVPGAVEDSAVSSEITVDEASSPANPIPQETSAPQFSDFNQAESLMDEQAQEMQADLSSEAEQAVIEPAGSENTTIRWDDLEMAEQPGDTPRLAEQLANTSQPEPVLASVLAQQSGPSKEKSSQAAPENPNRTNDPERVANAIASFLKVVEINPENDRAWDSLGNLYRITQRISDAIYAFEKATSLDPNKYLYRYQLGTSYAADGNYAAAIAEIKKSLELNPAFVFAHCALASFLRKTGQQEESQKHIALAAPLMLNQKEYDRACFESIRGNTSEALELLKIALEKKQTTAEWIRRDLDLDFIRNDPRFDQLATGYSQSVVEFERSKSR
jgi:superkiller protein 3